MAGGITVSGSVMIIDDNIDEDTESFSLHVHNCTNDVAGCSAFVLYSLITINDNDSKYLLLLPAKYMYAYTLIISVYTKFYWRILHMAIPYQCHNSFL